MLKRISLVFMLVIALVGIVGVQAQRTAEPQSMAQYLPADADFYFAVRTDGAFLDEISGLVNGIIEKLPPVVQQQTAGLNLKTLLEMQIGPLSETGLGDYVAASASNTTVLYDQDSRNDTEVVVYIVAALNDRAKFEAFIEKVAPNAKKSDENGTTMYAASAGMVNVLVTDDLAYLTNTAAMPSGDMLNGVSKFNDTLGKLPEASYNFLAYADFGPLFASMMTMMPPQSSAMFDSMGLDLANLGPIVIGGTVLDEKSLVIDIYSPSFGAAMMPSTAPIDPAFTNNIPSGFSFVVQGTDLKTSLNASLDLVYKMQEQQGSSNSSMPTRDQINSQLKAFLGIDLDNDIIGWLGGDYALIADFDMATLLTALESGKTTDMKLDPHFAFVVQGDGSDKPAKVVNAIGTLLIAQTKNMNDAPKINLSSEAGMTSIIIEDIPVSPSPKIQISLEIVGNKDFFIVGDKATVEAILSGDGNRLSGDASYVEAQKYILPNASSVAYAGGKGWGDLTALFGGLMGPRSMSSSTSDMTEQTKLLASVLRSVYDIIGSSSLSVAYNADGSQNSRAVFTLK